jgi:hypothetical protein
MKDEFDKIAGAVCDPVMFDKEINPTYLCFSSITKKEIAVMYWGRMPGTYGLWNSAKELAKELRAGFENDTQLNIWITRKNILLEAIKNLKVE